MDIRSYILKESFALEEALRPKRIKKDRTAVRRRKRYYRKNRVKIRRAQKLWRISPKGKKALRILKRKMRKSGYRRKTYVK